MSNYKPWMKELKAYRFARNGHMLTETQRDQREANTREATCVHLSREKLTPRKLKNRLTSLGFSFPYASPQ